MGLQTSASAQPCIGCNVPPPPPCIGCSLPQLPKVDLIVSLIANGSNLVEHSPIEVPFSIIASPGTGGIRPTRDLAVCPAEGGECVAFNQVTPPYSSPVTKLRMKAPAAGAAMPIRLVACIAERSADQVLSCGRELASDSISVQVAMRFGVYLDSFTILHTRARNKDTVWYGFAGRSERDLQPQFNKCITKLAGFVADGGRCYGPVKVGDRADGTHALNDIKIGDFQWVPGRPNQLKLAFMLVNAGAPKGIGPSKDMAGFAMINLVGKLATLGRGPINFTPELNALNGWRGCDGPTAAGTLSLFNFRDATHTDHTVDELTRTSGSTPMQTTVFTVPSQTLCGGSSKYRVRMSLRRSSWQAN